jgi:hypothetical protein
MAKHGGEKVDVKGGIQCEENVCGRIQILNRRMIAILHFLDHSKGAYTLGTSGIVEITTAVQLPTGSPTDS